MIGYRSGRHQLSVRVIGVRSASSRVGPGHLAPWPVAPLAFVSLDRAEPAVDAIVKPVRLPIRDAGAETSSDQDSFKLRPMISFMISVVPP